MKFTSIALALSVPALVAAAEQPATQECADVQELITAQARMEMSMMALQHPAPANKEDVMAQIAYVFQLCQAANEAVVQTAKEITSKETADAKALELAGRIDVYMGLCIAAAFTGLNADKLTEEQLEQLGELSDNQNRNDANMSAEMRRLEAEKYYGSEQLKTMLHQIYDNMPGVQVDEEPVKVEVAPESLDAAPEETPKN